MEQAIATINSAIANQIDWEEIEEIVKEAQSQMDPVASSIKSLKLNINQIVLTLQYVSVYILICLFFERFKQRNLKMHIICVLLLRWQQESNFTICFLVFIIQVLNDKVKVKYNQNNC